MAVVNVLDTEYHIDNKLKATWDKIREGKLTKIDEDRVFIVDGREGTGKSWFAFQQAAYIDPTFLNNIATRVTFTAEETLKAIRETKSTNVNTIAIIFDEAFRGLSSRAALSKVNKEIIQTLMEMRQNHLVLFIVLPSYFMLDLYPAISRSTALFHIVKNKKNNLRAFHVYNYAKKAKLYNIGLKKGWNYNLYTAFHGRFPGIFPGGEKYMQTYLDKKQKSLRDSSKDEVKLSKAEQYKEDRLKVALRVLKEQTKVDNPQISAWLCQAGWQVSDAGVQIYTGKARQIGLKQETTD
jgi:hypothetical protein